MECGFSIFNQTPVSQEILNEDLKVSSSLHDDFTEVAITVSRHVIEYRLLCALVTILWNC